MERYVGKLRHVEHLPFFNIDLNAFTRYLSTGMNIPEMHFKAQNQGKFENYKWLDEKSENDYVVINKTSRYDTGTFDWKGLVEKYRQKIRFIGNYKEYENFCAKYGHCKYHFLNDALEAARLIAGCKLFVSNQSLFHTIAEGLKVNLILELYCSDCYFHRDGATYVRQNEKTNLPEI